MDFQYKHSLSAPDYLRLRKAVGWKSVSARQAQAAIDRSDYLVSAEADGKTLASARLVSDGGTVFYIADVMVDPAYQGSGVGKTMVSMILEHVRTMLEEGEMVRVNLMAAVGREPFYEKQGFVRHPSDQFGAGMSYSITK
ncbi:GNAT family N-acetyltransferase [Caproicibacter fermentans]|uniref:GNAT family N-acetyltransferase n=1 Tax=Caproicibacter fermentans TaxID=2576756 RepID=A0A7G8T7L8_9FIRM|nr:GNAT family N-acetyltransferase [Caproicibacter fermentans]QNK39609.1 GNAT family N-acetyltransferase [Caproicibacter fermentans]